MGMSETQMLNQIWFEIHGGDKVKEINKDISDALKQMKRDSDLAQESIDKVVKKWTTLAQTPKNMSNISSAIYSKQEKRQVTNWTRNTHATPKYLASDYYNEGTIDYNAARTAWKAIEAEKKKSVKYLEEINKSLQEQARQAAIAAYTDKKANEQKSKAKGKAKPMNEYQGEKIRVEDEHNAIRRERLKIEAAAEARKLARDNSPLSRYRNAHPELFAVGGLYHSARFQTGHAFQTLGGVASSLGSGGRAVGLALDSLGAFFKAVPLGIATTISNLAKGIVELGKAAIQAYSDIEAIKTQLGVVFSNQTQADAMFGNISQYAVKSPFGVQQTSELAVLLKQSGVYASDLMDTLRMLGDTAGGNMEKMKRIANNYAQIVSIGKASMLDMRQFAYAGIPIFEAVSKELGVSQQELRKLISDGKVTSDIIEKVFKDLTGINGIFENATEKGAKTLKARLQNLQDAKQLALGEVGNAIVSVGERTGNDSFVNTVVTTAENIYQWLHDNVNTTNIEHDVEIIANRRERMEELSGLMSSFSDNALMKSLVGIAFNSEQALHDVDYERNVYNQSYEAKMKGHNQAVERFGITDLNEAEEFLKTVKFFTSTWNRIQYPRLSEEGAYEGGGYGNKAAKEAQESAKRFGIDLDFITNTTKEESRAIVEAVNSLVQALSDYSKVTEEEAKAHRESTIIDAQQLAFDQAARASSAEGSYTKGFEELYSLYTSSDEYKQEQQQKQIAFLKESQNVLRELVKYADKEGNVDISKLSYNKLLQYIDPNKRVLDEGSKLSVVEGKSEQKMTEDRKLLMSQWSKVSGDVLADLKNKGLFSAAEQLQAAKDAYSLNGDNKTFFENFDRILEQQLGILEELASSESNETKKAEYQAMSRAIMASTFRYGVNDKGLLANPEELIKGSKQEFIPLWKRILAQYTGLSTLEMTSTADTMKKYSEDMAIRNMTSNVMSATMKSMGFESAMRLVSAGGAKQLKEDSAGTIQVNWKQTQENIKKFSLALSASTEVVSAYKKSLEDELEVYQQLIVAGYTQGENQNGGESQFISVKKLAQYAQSNEQLVNAFGDTLETASGKKYSVDDLRFTQEGIFDKLGNKIDDQVKVTSNLSRFIENILPKLYEDIAKASDRVLDNGKLSELLKSTGGNYLSNQLLAYKGISETSAYLLNDPEYLKEKFMNNIKVTRNVGLRKELFKNMSDEDLFAKAMSIKPADIKAAEEFIAKGGNNLNTPEGKEGQRILELSKIINNTIDKVYSSTDDFVNSGSFKSLFELLKTVDRDTSVRNELVQLTDFFKNLKEGNSALTAAGEVITAATTLKPEDYSGMRGVRNRIFKYGFGIDQDYDIEDLYLQAAKTANLEGQNVNQFGLNAEDFKGLSDEEILINLEKQKNGWLEIIKAQEDSYKILSAYGNEMASIIADFGKGTITKPLEKMGENLVLGKNVSEDMRDVYKDLASELLAASGAAMTKAGWELVARGAADKNYAMIGAGLALAGAGAFAAGVGNGLANSDKETKDAEDKAKRLEDLKNDLADLLKQAREDAIYYENTVRHKQAISANDELTQRNVHDAIITPRGEVVNTDPRDYLIATKTPRTLVGGGAPTINFNVVDKSTGIRVTQQSSTYNEETNTIEFEAIIESKVQEVIASPKGDDAFNAREARLRGRSVIA